MGNKKSAYVLARLPIGFSFLGHGIVRLPKLAAFAQGMAESFNNTFLPPDLVLLFAYVLPVVELLIGLLLISGIAIRQTTIAGVLLICLLIFGSSLQENWSAVATQMFYGLYLSLLHLFNKENNYSLFNSKNKIQ
ncbi:hypothetical protein GCM10011506_35790 [Marivirga lumbricoides]|uniref:DoxX family protein n=1 Tax=Marivirga lumbricoides TaxID=1046115 RepID=A0A2T4DQR3_9BACT|nr:DoxX family protein [Marivirga lumbricoides]GGC47051.1 hypothetical protein GCM10011506_35790 [Marivirga lumbricoides]